MGWQYVHHGTSTLAQTERCHQKFSQGKTGLKDDFFYFKTDRYISNVQGLFKVIIFYKYTIIGCVLYARLYFGL